MALPSLDIGTVSSVGDVEFLERLGVGIGSGRFKARSGADGPLVSLLLAETDKFDKQGLVEWARRLKRVDHPGIPGVVQIEDVLEPGFVAQRFIEGETLAERASRERGPKGVVDALALILQGAAAIAAVHRADLAHGALSDRSLVLEGRDGAMDAVRIVGWRPLAAGLTLERAIGLDVRRLGELLFQLLAGVGAPRAEPEEPVDPGAPYRVNFADLVVDWDAGSRPAGPARDTLVALGEWHRIESIDMFVDALLPTFSREVAEALDEVAYELSADREFKAEVEQQRKRQRELESKLRFIKDWLRDNAPSIDVVDDKLAGLEAQERSLRNLEVELAMLLDRSVRPGESLAATAQARPVRSPTPAPGPIQVDEEPTFVETLPTDEPVAAAPPPRVDRAPPPVVASGGGWGRTIGVAVLAAGLAGGAVWFTTRTPPPAGIADAAPASAAAGTQAPASVAAGTIASAAPKTVAPSSVAPSSVTPASTASAEAPPTAAPATVAVPMAPAPAGMVLIPAGTVHQGLSNAIRDAAIAQCKADTAEFPKMTETLCIPEALTAETKTATARVEAFYMDRLEVSQLQYERCVNQRRCRTLKLTWDLDEQPATGVTWDMAVEYCKDRGARLPTPEEWLRAARGDDERLYPWGDTSPVDGERHKANYGRMDRKGPRPSRADGHKYAAPVGVFAERGQSAFGIANLAGNVREWTSAVEADGAVVTGGGWRDLGMDLRVTRRQVVPKDQYFNDLGFRCVADARPAR